MAARRIFLFSMVLFLFVFSYLTFREIQVSGLNVLTVVAFIVIGAAGVGLVGALTNRPHE